MWINKTKKFEIKNKLTILTLIIKVNFKFKL